MTVDLLTNLRREIATRWESLGKEITETQELLREQETEHAELTEARVVLDGRVPESPAAPQSRWVGPPVTDEQLRDWFVEVKRFTAQQCADHFLRSMAWAYTRLAPFEGKIIRVAEEFVYSPIRKPRVYEYIPISEVSGPTTRSNGHRQNGHKQDGATVVSGTGRSKRTSNDKDTNALLRRAKSQGFRVRKHRGHTTVVNPKTGEKRTVSGTPGDNNAARNVKRDLEELGAEV